MSCIIYAIIEYKKDIPQNIISDKCFDFISFACSRKVAINRIDYADSQIDYLKKNEMGMRITDSYVFWYAETFLEADFDLPDPLEGKRLKDLEEFLAFVLESSVTERIRLYVMETEEYEEDAFEKIKCDIHSFTENYKEMIFCNILCVSYEFIFEK